MFWIWKPGAVSHISQLFCCLKSGCEALFTLCWTPARGGLVLADGRGAEARLFLLRPDEALIALLPGTGSAASSSHRCWRGSDCWQKGCEESVKAALGTKAFMDKRVLTWCSEVVELPARRWAGGGLEFWPRRTEVLKLDGCKPVVMRCDCFHLWQETPLSYQG